MSLISPNFAVQPIIFSQFWPGAFSQNCWKKPPVHVLFTWSDVISFSSSSPSSKRNLFELINFSRFSFLIAVANKKFTLGLDQQNFSANIFLPINFSICFGWSKTSSLKNKKNISCYTLLLCFQRCIFESTIRVCNKKYRYPKSR